MKNILRKIMMGCLPFVMALGFSVSAKADTYGSTIASSDWVGKPDYVYADKVNFLGNHIWWTMSPGTKKIDWDIRNAYQSAYTSSSGKPVYTINTAIKAGDTNKKATPEGYHTYESEKGAEYIYIDKWVYDYAGVCIHGDYSLHYFDNFSTVNGAAYHFNYNSVCLQNYENRYIGYCRDCGEAVGLLVTGSTEEMKNLYKIPNGSFYYYLCPQTNADATNGSYVSKYEGHMEQGWFYEHKCTEALSPNRYTVQFNLNAPAGESDKNGLTRSTSGYYYYHGATEYEENTTDGNTSYTKEFPTDIFSINGYKFDGWYTAPTGGEIVEKFQQLESKQSASFLNTNNGTIQVYARWVPISITLQTVDSYDSPTVRAYYHC